MPDQRDFVDLDMTCNNLSELRCERWGQWIFVNRDSDAQPLDDFLKPVMPELEQFDLGNLRFYCKSSIAIAADKIAINVTNEEVIGETIRVTNLAGQEVYNGTVKAGNQTITLANVTTGMYIATIEHNSKVLRKKVFIGK